MGRLFKKNKKNGEKKPVPVKKRKDLFKRKFARHLLGECWEVCHSNENLNILCFSRDLLKRQVSMDQIVV